MTTEDPYGEFSKIAPAYTLIDYIKKAGIDYQADMVWILPLDVLAGVTNAYGLDVIRVEGVEPMVALRPKTGAPL